MSCRPITNKGKANKWRRYKNCLECRRRKEKERAEKRDDKLRRYLNAQHLKFENWIANLHIVYDANVFTEKDIFEIVQNAGAEAGVGVGRKSSPNGIYMGWGHFECVKS